MNSLLLAHQADPRVAITETKARFLHAAEQRFRAAIFHRGEGVKDKVRRHFKKVSGLPYTEDYSLKIVAHAHMNPRVGIVITGLPPELYPVRKELYDMASAYNTLTGIEKMKLLFIEGRLGKHKHSYPVLNCSWFGDGTYWSPKKGSDQSVEEGDWFYFGARFGHASAPHFEKAPPPKQPKRICAAIVPEFPFAKGFL